MLWKCSFLNQLKPPPFGYMAPSDGSFGPMHGVTKHPYENPCHQWRSPFIAHLQEDSTIRICVHKTKHIYWKLRSIVTFFLAWLFCSIHTNLTFETFSTGHSNLWHYFCITICYFCKLVLGILHIFFKWCQTTQESVKGNNNQILLPFKNIMAVTCQSILMRWSLIYSQF